MIYLCQKNPEKNVQVSPKYFGPKLYNMVPKYIKEAKTMDDFKIKLKEWIWEKIH